MQSRPTPDAQPQVLLVCLQPAAPVAQLLRHGERLARGLGCGWRVACEGLAPGEQAAALQVARRAGAIAEPGDATSSGALSAAPAAAIADMARSRQATTVIAAFPADPAQRSGFARELALALPGVTLHLVGRADAAQTGRPSWAWSALRQAWADAPVVVAVLLACTLVGLALQGSHEPATLIMVYLAGVVYIALRRDQPAALLAVLGSVLLYDLVFVVQRGSGLPGPHNHLLVSLVLIGVGLLISQLAEQLRAQTAAAETRERRTQALNRLALALAQARTTESIGLALSQAVHRSLSAIALLVPVDDPSAGPRAATVDPPEPGSCQVPLRVGDEALAVLEVELLPPAHDTPEDRALLEAFASQGAIALERALFEQRSASAAIEAERERLRNTLLAGVSHDFRTPLTTIVGSTTSLLEQSHALDPEQRTALLRGVLSEARRLHGLTSNLLDLARMQEGAIRPNLEWCPADELVDESCTAAATALAGRELVVNVDAELVVWCDPRLIGQALVNLLDNAARHAGARARIEIGVSADADHWRLQVQDDGPGIPPGLEQDVFKKFVRGPAPGGGSSSHGTGLGLAICEAVAQLHGGRITVQSGPGARFELVLPQPTPARASLEEPA